MTREQAEMLAITILTFIAAEQPVMEAFLAQTGLSREDIASNASDAEFLGGVIDFLLSDETTLLDFCQANDVDPELPAKARYALPGANYI